jgi:uncharacterized protein YjbI with pentapeptide repeats
MASRQQITKRLLMLASIVVVCAGTVILIFAGHWLNEAWTGFRGKTLWDWLNLLGVLAIPVVVGLGTVWFTTKQGQVSDVTNKDNQRESALQSYLDRMSELLLKENLRKSEPDAEIWNIARVRTLTVLRALDPKRKGSVLRFLSESGLINIIDLSEADLTEAELCEVNLEGARLERAKLCKANLMGANLMVANLRRADLSDAYLVDADLSKANLTTAKLKGARLSAAFLCEADLSYADLEYADLGGATLPATSTRGDKTTMHVPGANLSGANLEGVNLSGAKLKWANLTNAKLPRANLIKTDMSETLQHKTDLTGAIYTIEQLNSTESRKGVLFIP